MVWLKSPRASSDKPKTLRIMGNRKNPFCNQPQYLDQFLNLPNLYPNKKTDRLNSSTRSTTALRRAITHRRGMRSHKLTLHNFHPMSSHHSEGDWVYLCRWIGLLGQLKPETSLKRMIRKVTSLRTPEAKIMRNPQAIRSQAVRISQVSQPRNDHSSKWCLLSNQTKATSTKPKIKQGSKKWWDWQNSPKPGFLKSWRCLMNLKSRWTRNHLYPGRYLLHR